MSIANKIRSNGEDMKEDTIVEKILRTLIEKFNFVFVSVEESKDIDKFTVDELQSSLVAHEQKFIRPSEEKHVLKEEIEDEKEEKEGKASIESRLNVSNVTN
ncbi:hypothetical protein CR513_07665, partial [Mucuna pruriens]